MVTGPSILHYLWCCSFRLDSAVILGIKMSKTDVMDSALCAHAYVWLHEHTRMYTAHNCTTLLGAVGITVLKMHTLFRWHKERHTINRGTAKLCGTTVQTITFIFTAISTSSLRRGKIRTLEQCPLLFSGNLNLKLCQIHTNCLHKY